MTYKLAKSLIYKEILSKRILGLLCMTLQGQNCEAVSGLIRRLKAHDKMS